MPKAVVIPLLVKYGRRKYRGLEDPKMILARMLAEMTVARAAAAIKVPVDSLRYQRRALGLQPRKKTFDDAVRSLGHKTSGAYFLTRTHMNTREMASELGVALSKVADEHRRFLAGLKGR